MNMVYLISSLTIDLQVFSKTSVNNIFLFLCTQLAAWFKFFYFLELFPLLKAGSQVELRCCHICIRILRSFENW